MSRRRGLGSGLDALIPSATAGAGEAVRQVAVGAIRENRSQPRSQFDDQALAELAESIREHGVIQPLIVSEDASGAYELIAGERRLRAARLAGLREVPVLVKSATPQQLLELALVENVQRADLNPLEEGLAYQTLKDEFGLSDEVIARRVGKSRVAVVNTRRLTRLAPAARDALLAGELSAGHGRALLRFEAPAEQERALLLLRRRDMSVREAERLGELAHHGQLGQPARDAMLSGALSLAQAQALLRVEEPGRQQATLERILSLGLGARESEQLADLVADGAPLDTAVAQLRQQAGGQQRRPVQEGLGRPALGGEARGQRPLTPEDAEAQRLFEEILETPVQLTRSGATIRLTITLFDDAQLQQLYDRLSGG
jgi:ParB family chromosome partitioning protein